MNSKATQDRHQRILLDLVRQPGNDVCADCRGRAPRWASWNLGIFLCVQCAGVHRKMGTHISKVKSLTLDTWTREQVDRMKEVGNVQSNRFFNPDEMRNRPPTNMEESERDSELEKFVRAKYEYRRFVESKPPPVPTKDGAFLRLPSSSSGSSLRAAERGPNGVGEQNSRRRATGQVPSLQVSSDGLDKASSILRSRTAPIPGSWAEAQARARSVSPAPPMPASSVPRASALGGSSASRTLALDLPNPVPPRATSAVPNARSASLQAQLQASKQPTAASSVFDDLISLGTPSHAAPQPAPQMNPWAHIQAQTQQTVFSAPAVQEPLSTNLWSSSHAVSSPFQPQQTQQALGAAAFARPPQHASTLPNFSITSPDGQSQAQQQLLGGGSLQYQQHRSASLGTMAFSPGASSPVGNPFFQGGASMMQQQQQQQQQYQQQGGLFGQSFGTHPPTSPGPGLGGMTMSMGLQQQSQPHPQTTGTSPFGNFASSMMPSQRTNGVHTGLYQGEGQTSQPAQQLQQQQYGQAQAVSGMYAVQAGQQAFGHGMGGGYWG